MPLDFGLFGREGLEQETGLLSERWGQIGSNLINIQFSLDDTDGEDVQYTVTAGKSLYVTQIIINVNVAFDGLVNIEDGSGNTVLAFPGTTNPSLSVGTHVINFDTPLKFNTDITTDEHASNGDSEWTITGWEE